MDNKELVVEKVVKDRFYVLGKVGSTRDGVEFIPNLWDEVNTHFKEIEPYAILVNGRVVDSWGIMNDFHEQYMPWENDYTQGIYLAGIEVKEKIDLKGWICWQVPAMEYIRIECNDDYPFEIGMEYLRKHGYELVAGTFDYNHYYAGKYYLYFPIRKL